MPLRPSTGGCEKGSGFSLPHWEAGKGRASGVQFNSTSSNTNPQPLSFTHFNPTSSNTNPQPLPGPYRRSSPPLPAPPLMIHSARCVKVHLTREKCFSVPYETPVGIWTASSPPSPPSLLGYGIVPCAPLLPLIPGSTTTPPLLLSHPRP